MAGADIASLLKNAEIFQALLDDDIRYLVSKCALKELAAEEELFAAGAKADRFYIVASGEISVCRKEGGRRSAELARFCPGEVVGDFDFAINRRHSDSAYASSDARLVEFPAGGLRLSALAEEKPDTVARILLKSLAMVSSRLRSTHGLIRENAPWIRELRRQISTDASTGLWSRAYLEEEIPGRLKDPSLVLVLKPDKFKVLVDGHGHAAGDAAMRKIALRLKALAAPAEGWAVRLVSNVTALVVPGVSGEEADRIVAAAAAPLRVDEPDFPDLTMSAARGSWPGDCANFRELVERCEKVAMRVWLDDGRAVARVPGTGERVTAGRP
jgi:CRP-like cAMP-binding protein